MKHFIDANERAASGHENYIEFQLPCASKEFWDDTSLYISEEVLGETGFVEFWSNCMYDGIVFDMSSFTKDELAQMAERAAECGGTVLEVITELKAWVDTQLIQGNSPIFTIWESDRALARREARRKAYPVDPNFYREVEEMLKELPFPEHEKAYEALLCKYNMPSCFFPFSLYEPDKWE